MGTDQGSSTLIRSVSSDSLRFKAAIKVLTWGYLAARVSSSDALNICQRINTLAEVSHCTKVMFYAGSAHLRGFKVHVALPSTQPDVSKQHVGQSSCPVLKGGCHIVGTASVNWIKCDSPNTCQKCRWTWVVIRWRKEYKLAMIQV